ncbi:hypothetical protein HAX54_016938, partial [Datura stramonium]|nr:hypothetical protein [Datura stramonium]
GLTEKSMIRQSSDGPSKQCHGSDGRWAVTRFDTWGLSVKSVTADLTDRQRSADPSLPSSFRLVRTPLLDKEEEDSNKETFTPRRPRSSLAEDPTPSGSKSTVRVQSNKVNQSTPA